MAIPTGKTRVMITLDDKVLIQLKHKAVDSKKTLSNFLAYAGNATPARMKPDVDSKDLKK